MERKKKLPIGIEDFEEIIEQDFYYADKTGFIKELLDNWCKVNLFTRPRRFGKSLNMSMLKHFFEIGSNKDVFEGLEISKETSPCEEYMGRFPVISVSLKGVSGSDYQEARDMMKGIIGEEARRHRYLMNSDRLDQYDKRVLEALLLKKMETDTLKNSLRNLSEFLYRHYGKKVIILIDEYDVPLAQAYDNGYYDQMVDLLRGIFEQALKTNESLQFAVLTGCMRISKESIFTGLNNPKIHSITDVRFDEYFGFTDKEVKEMLTFYGFEDYYEMIKEWYDGFHFGNVDVYCPWDVINYLDELRANPKSKPKDYWINTSSNDIVRRFIRKAQSTTAKREIEQLLAGETIRKEIHQELTYRDLDNNIDNLWSVLYTTGYLTLDGEPDGDVFGLKIPNLEIRKIFTKQICTWFQESAVQDGTTLNVFCEAFQKGDAAGIEAQFNEYLWNTISIRDTFVKGEKENFYHGILLGLLRYKESWAVSSNRESGDGYSDIVIEIGKGRVGIIIELKYAKDGNLEKGCVEALEQIEKNNYEEELRNNGMRTILRYGIACYKKHCKVLKH